MATSKKRGRGAPTKLTTAVQNKICKAVKLGMPYDLAAAYADISYQTMRNWMKRGESAKAGIQRDFFEAVKKAEAVALADRLEDVVKAGGGIVAETVRTVEKKIPQADGKELIIETTTTTTTKKEFDWRASAWWAERKFPNEFGRVHRMQLENTEGDEIPGPLILVRDPKAYAKKDDDDQGE